MINVLTEDHPRLLNALRSSPLRKLGLSVTVADRSDQLLTFATERRPDVVVMVGGSDEPHIDGRLARQLRHALASAGTRVFLALPRARAGLDNDLALFDGFISLEEPELDLMRIFTLTTSAPMWRQARMHVRIPALLMTRGGRPIDGFAMDLGTCGAGLILRRCPEDDGPYELQLYRPDGRSVTLAVRGAWLSAHGGPPVRMGVRFVDGTLNAIRRIYDLAQWELVAESGHLVLYLHGALSEGAALRPLLGRIAQAQVIDLSDVSQVNAWGIMRWIELLAELPPELTLRLRRLSPPMARAMEQVPEMATRCTIEPSQTMPAGRAHSHHRAK